MADVYVSAPHFLHGEVILDQKLLMIPWQIFPAVSGLLNVLLLQGGLCYCNNVLINRCRIFFWHFAFTYVLLNRASPVYSTIFNKLCTVFVVHFADVIL